MKRYNITSLKEVIQIQSVLGEYLNVFFNNVKPIDLANEDSLAWIKPTIQDKKSLLKTTKSRIILGDDSLIPIHGEFPEKVFLIVENPKLEFVRIIKKFFIKKIKPGISKSAVIHSEADIHSSVFIGDNVVVGKCIIGKDSIVEPNCTIYDNVRIGKNVKINANTVIGSEGFGYSRNEENEFELFPHIGGVIIEDNVDIGSNTSIDRGTLGDTIIKTGAKIDNLVHIAHNVIVGRHSAVIANAMIGGSVEIGDYSWIAPSVSIMNQAIISEEVIVGMGAVVTKNISKEETWAGNPARPLKEFINIQRKIKNL